MPSDVLPPNFAVGSTPYGSTSIPSDLFLPSDVPTGIYSNLFLSADPLPAILVLGSTPTYFRRPIHSKPFLTSDTLPPIFAVGPTCTHFRPMVHSHLFPPAPLRPIFAHGPTPTYFRRRTYSHPFSPTGPLPPIFARVTHAYFCPRTHSHLTHWQKKAGEWTCGQIRVGVSPTEKIGGSVC